MRDRLGHPWPSQGVVQYVSASQDVFALVPQVPQTCTVNELVSGPCACGTNVCTEGFCDGSACSQAQCAEPCLLQLVLVTCCSEGSGEGTLAALYLAHAAADRLSGASALMMVRAMLSAIKPV